MVFVPFHRCFVEFQKVKAVVKIINELHETSVDWLSKPLKFGFGVRYVDPNAVSRRKSLVVDPVVRQGVFVLAIVICLLTLQRRDGKNPDVSTHPDVTTLT